MLKKLRIKFVCMNMTIITLMLVLIFNLIVQFTSYNLEQNSIQMLQQLASNPFYIMKPSDRMDVRLPYFSLRLNPDGSLLETSSGDYNMADAAYLEKLVYEAALHPGSSGELQEHKLRFLKINTPAEHILIFADISSEEAAIATLKKNCIIVGIVSFFLFLLISILFARWSVRPVEKAWIQQKQFLADASHELKTPLTVIFTNAELLQDTNCPRDDRIRLTESIVHAAAQMRCLVTNLLELSRADQNAMKLIMENLDFSSLTEISASLFEPLFFEAGKILETDIQKNLTIKGSETHLQQAESILLDNALKYSEDNSIIRLQLSRQRKYCLLSVSSFGTPISQEDLENIFQRFYRIEKSRTSSGSYGLGLSIAKSIIKEHHGKIWAESKNGCNTFYIALSLL